MRRVAARGDCASGARSSITLESFTGVIAPSTQWDSRRYRRGSSRRSRSFLCTFVPLCEIPHSKFEILNSIPVLLITARNLPSIAQSSTHESSASSPPGYLRSDDIDPRDPTFSELQLLCAHLIFRFAGSAGPSDPLYSRRRTGWGTHAGNRPDERLQQKRPTSDRTRSLNARVLALAMVRQPAAGSFDKKRDVRPEAPTPVAREAKRGYRTSLARNTRASGSGESVIEIPPIELLSGL